MPVPMIVYAAVLGFSTIFFGGYSIGHEDAKRDQDTQITYCEDRKGNPVSGDFIFR